MQLNELKLLTDENIQSEFVSYLREQEHDVIDVKEENLVGESDKQLLEFAFIDNLVIVTHDSDFGRLIFQGEQTFWGIIYLRPGHFDPNFSIQTWESLAEASLDFKFPFILVAINTGEHVRIRYRQH